MAMRNRAVCINLNLDPKASLHIELKAIPGFLLTVQGIKQRHLPVVSCAGSERGGFYFAGDNIVPIKLIAADDHRYIGQAACRIGIGEEDPGLHRILVLNTATHTKRANKEPQTNLSRDVADQ